MKVWLEESYKLEGVTPHANGKMKLSGWKSLTN